ncbi:LPD38 domain-containing protein, partial [Photobacterium phosphoreum]|uniref:LPD38 domain-containing protein n=1 Tax=Photobacterium phosphoreum TaxID=659 RepID=UPI001E3F785F
LVPSEAPPSVVYGHDNTPPQQEVSPDDKQVGTPQFENGIPKNKLRQLKYLAKRVSDKIPLAMQPLKGAARFTRPEYRTRLVSLADEATAMSNSKTINVQVDTISDAITKLGGVSRASAESDGIDPAAFKRNKLFPAKDGRTFDELAEVLNEHGFTSRTGGKLGANDVLDLVDSEVNNGERHFSTQSDMLTETDQGSALSDLVREYGAGRVQTAISKALTGARLGDRQAEIVNEAMDVIETGRIEQAGGIEARHAERDARREARIAKRKQHADIVNSDLGLPAWVNDDAAQAESEYTETVEAALDQAISHAAIADPVAAENLLDQYEANKITMASLIDQLGALEHDDQQKLTNMENTQPTAEGTHSDSTTQRIEQGQENPQPAMGTVGSSSTTSDQQHAAVAEVEPVTDILPQVEVAPLVEITQAPVIEAVTELEQSDTATKQDVQQEVVTEKSAQVPQKSQPVKSHGVSIDAPYITQETQDNYNRATHIGSGRDFNAELTKLANDQLNELHEKGLLDTPERIAVAKQSIEALLNKQVDFITRESNYATNNPSWIVTGRSGRNMDKVNKRNDRHMSDFSKRVDEIESLRGSIVSTVEAVRNDQQKVDHEKATKQAQIKKHEKVIVDYLAQTYQYLLEGKPALARDARVWVNKKVTKQLSDLIEKDKDAAYLLINKINKAYNKEGKVTLIDVVSSRSALGKQLKQIIDADNKPSKSNKPTSFSREGVTPDVGVKTKGMPLKQAEMAVKSWLRQYNGGAMVNVKVVQTQAEAEQILGASLNGYKVNAFYNEVDATVVVVAENIANTKELRQKLRHEILVHHGLRAVVGDAEYGRILKTVYSGLDSRFLKPLIAEVEKGYDRSNLNNFVEEVLAHTAENERNQIQKWRDRVIASIAQALRKIGLLTPSDITQAELNNIVQTLTDRIKAVNEWDPNTTPPSGNGMKGHLSRTKFSRTANNDSTSAFQSAVDQARAKLASKVNGPIADVADAGFDIPTDNLKSTIARKLADKFQVLKELQKNIVKSGGNINEDNDAYLAEELFHGKAENDLRIMKDTFIKPLADKMAKHDISQAQLDEYLIARHAQERNDYIASINPKFPDGGSGMKNADAQAKLDEIRNSGKQQKYDELAHIVDAMITKQRDVLRDSGLETDEIIDTWQSHYKHYVPLKGIAKDESSLPRTGKGFSIGGKEVKNAMGRKSMAESPSGHAILDLTEKLVRSRKNEVGNTLLKMVNDNPSADYWQVFTTDSPDTAPQTVERKNPLTGAKEKVVEDRPVPMSMLKEFYFPTKKDGKVYYIKLHDQRLMNAMQNMGPDTSNGIIRFMAGFNRILASVNTSYNPEFVVGNFLLDIQTTVLNLSAEQSRDDGKIKGEAIVKQTIKDIRKAAPAIYASLRNKTSKSPETQEWQRHFEEFMEVGGKTGWFDMKDVDGQAKELDRMVAMANGSASGKAYKAFENVTGFVENINGSIENAVRLSAYVNTRKAGVSKKKAASLAKNMTVNFNRRGEVGTTLNAMYMFANASIQGSANFIRTMGDLNGDGKLKWENLNNAQKIAIGVVAGSFALAFANRGVAGDDEDGVNWFDKIPSYVKERNFIIMKSLLGGEADGSYWSIPMPYGYNLFSIAGTGIESAVNSDNITPMQMVGDMALATLGSFSPIGMSSSDTAAGTVLKNVLPTIAKPFFEVSTNENFFGGQIYQENMPFGTKMPDSSMAKRATSDHYKAVAEWLNESTGGSVYRSGAIDLSPDVMQYIVGYFGGAAMRFADVKVPGLFGKAIGGDVEDSKVAFLSRISGRVMPYQDQSAFYDRRDELMQIGNEIGAIKATDRVVYMKEHGYKLQLLPMLKMTEKQLKALRKQRNAIYALDLPRAQKDLRLKSVERQMKMLIDRFNLRYVQLSEK